MNSLAFSRDSKRLISGSGPADRSAIIWDLEAHKPLHRLQGHTAEVYGVAFTPDGQRVVSGSYDTTLRLWRVGDGSLIAELKGHKAKVFRVAVNPIDGSIASGSNDGEIRLWDGATGIPLRAWMQPGSNPGSLSFSPDGKSLLSGTGSFGPDRNVHVWNVADGKEILITKHDNIVAATAISRNGMLAATGGGNRFPIHVWDLATGAPVKGPAGKPVVLAGTSASVYAAGFSADGRHIAWGNTDVGTVNLQREPYQYSLRLPAPRFPLATPERIGEHGNDDFLRARAVVGAYTLYHRKGGKYGFDAILDLRQGDKVIANRAWVN